MSKTAVQRRPISLPFQFEGAATSFGGFPQAQA